MFVKSAVVALFAAFAAAQLHPPVGDKPEGNPITRPLNEAVEAGKPFTITWQPTEPGHTVSLLLLKGPSNNVVPVGEPIAEGIPNSGSLVWTPPAEFGPGITETTGYGIQIIDDVTGKYQYSTQFGITVPEGYKPSSTPSGYPTGTPSASKNASTKAPTATATISASYTGILSTGAPISNSSIIQPTKPITVPSSLKTTTYPTGPTTPTSSGVTPADSTGAAGQLKAGLGLAAGVAGLFFML
ncbi:uncharacterized protein EI97DRAFT_451746 [Westerdykella ornata]|uniref:Yeast cell wall synthesis Kre9/Knh1-like N-terminal domain-containing protein n=1 Tax=Westerdykella ornata TaxID=318751 RepID=A0A6A6JE00_WESOR|nr:uncharacterized protein EI97DRAFT_451746 [Westerdykella ornata]KAF2274434.1 hypothetical protein EI97DRAFT_451746 [Westerdykella ornata]